MEYTRLGLSNGDKLKAEHIDHIEGGIVDNAWGVSQSKGIFSTTLGYIYPEWEQGSASSGGYNSSENDIRTEFINTEGVEAVHVDAPDGWNFRMIHYNADETYANYTTKIADTVNGIFPTRGDPLVRFRINRADAPILPDEGKQVLFRLPKSLLDEKADKAELDALINSDTMTMQTFKKEELITGAFIQYADGIVKSNSNYLRTDSITIPGNCKTITHSFPFSETGTDGWAMYDNKGVFVSGGKDKMLAVPENAKSIMLSYKKSETGDASITFWPGGKKIAFMGDSVTYGASPDDANDVDGDERLQRPWPETVGQLLKTPTINLGKNSATLMVGTTASGNPTPLALVRDYVNYSDDYDIVGFMIGINDLYRSALNIEGSPYTLGTMEDRTADTFYGALHVFIKGMIAKYPPLDHKVFAMIYPYYHGNDKNRDLVPKYFGAIREVARYYSLPILDLEAELCVNVLSDPGLANGTAGVYWVKETNSHPTQAGADMIAQVVANFIHSRFFIDF